MNNHSSIYEKVIYGEEGKPTAVTKWCGECDKNTAHVDGICKRCEQVQNGRKTKKVRNYEDLEPPVMTRIPCLGYCGKKFMSEGKHNRFCNNCKKPWYRLPTTIPKKKAPYKLKSPASIGA